VIGVDNSNVLWAKKSNDHTVALWLPLAVHLNDVAEVARLLWDRWIPLGIKKTIYSGVLSNGQQIKQELIESLLYFLAFIHDVGKATPIFQCGSGFYTRVISEELRRGIIEAGFELRDSYDGKKETRHSLVSHVIMRRNGFDDSVAVVVGGHHGIPPNKTQILDLEGVVYDSACGFDKENWRLVQDSLVAQALARAKLDIEVAASFRLTRQAQVLLSGIIILADWIASDTKNMPLIPLEVYCADSKKRAIEALSAVDLPAQWEPDWDLHEIYQRRFNIENPRPIQNAIVEAVASCYSPGIIVVEAPMGEGKTEAALAAAELLASRTGCRGIYFALPSQATSDAMYARVLDWIKRFENLGEYYSVRLIHGRAELNEIQSALKLSKNINLSNDENGEDDEQNVIVHEWLSGRKLGMLADFAVGTIDQVLMAALRQKHLVLRHLGLSGKVVIIDECHAYDVYMESYLLKALEWFGAYGVPVIVLSATLPVAKRRAVIQAYMNKKTSKESSVSPWVKKTVKESVATADEHSGSASIDTKAYPLISYSDRGDVKQVEVQGAVRRLEVEFQRVNDEQAIEVLKTSLKKGGVAGVIVNTVKRAQKMYLRLVEEFGDDVCLLHSQFLASDRRRLEKTLIHSLGPADNNERPYRMIVVGTQIFEQSMDIDFDVLVAEICPIDLLIQRVGRLFRHERERPVSIRNAVCYVIGADDGNFERGSEWVYGKYLLMRTLAALPDRAVLPTDIPNLVADVYDDSEEIPDEIMEEKEKWAQKMQLRSGRANAFQVSSPYISAPLLGWLDISASDPQGEAAVRDGSDSLEVIVVQHRDKELCFLPWIEQGQALPLTEPDDELSRKLLGCTLRLPALLSAEWNVEKTINELEESMVAEGLKKGWYQSHLLKGVLVMVLNENQEIMLCGHQLRYNEKLGLCVTSLPL